MVRAALPGGKSLESVVRGLFADAGISIHRKARSTHLVTFPDYPALSEGIFAKPSRVPVLVERGAWDLGITGIDVVRESGADVEILTTLAIGRSTSSGETSVVLYCSADDPIKSVKDIPRGAKVLSEYPNLTRRYFAKRGMGVKVVDSPGSSEAEVPELYRFGVVLSETGNSLRENNLKVLDTITPSATCLIAKRSALRQKGRRRAIEVLQSILVGTIEARGKVLLVMNVSAKGLPKVLKNLPALGSPTIAPLADGGSSVSVVVTKAERNRLIGELKGFGASGFISHDLGIIVP